MIVDADIEIVKILPGPQPQRRRLLAATLAAGTLAGLQRRQQALGQGQIAASGNGIEGLGDHGLPAQYVAGQRDMSRGPIAAGGKR